MRKTGVFRHSLYSAGLTGKVPGLFMIGAAILVGRVASQENWFALGAITSLGFLLLWPMITAIGSYVLLVPFDHIFSFGTDAHRTTLTWFLGAAAATVLLVIGIAGNRFQQPPKAALWWSLLGLWAAASSVWAVNSELTLHRLPTVFSLLSLYVIVVSLRFTARELRWILSLTLLGGCAAALVASFAFYHGLFFQGLVTHRGSLVVGNRETDPNRFAASLLLPLSLATGNILVRRTYKRILALLTVAALVLSLFLSMSRGALLGVA